MSFPPRTVAQRSVKGRGARVKALGNSVSPHVSYIVGCQLADHLLRATEEAS